MVKHNSIPGDVTTPDEKSVAAGMACKIMAAKAVSGSVEASKCRCHNCRVLEVLELLLAHSYIAAMHAYNGDLSILKDTLAVIMEVQRKYPSAIEEDMK